MSAHALKLRREIDQLFQKLEAVGVGRKAKRLRDRIRRRCDAATRGYQLIARKTPKIRRQLNGVRWLQRQDRILAHRDPDAFRDVQLRRIAARERKAVA